VPLELGSRWLVREWEDGAVLYDRKTGDTHAIDPFAVEFLCLPESARYDPAQASRMLGERLGGEIDAETLRSAIDAAFEQLRRIELL
jgi:PqqD family protein of HPr-rel-A system